MSYSYYTYTGEFEKLDDSRNGIHNLKKKLRIKNYMWLVFPLNILFIILMFLLILLRPRNSKQWL